MGRFYEWFQLLNATSPRSGLFNPLSRKGLKRVPLEMVLNSTNRRLFEVAESSWHSKPESNGSSKVTRVTKKIVKKIARKSLETCSFTVQTPHTKSNGKMEWFRLESSPFHPTNGAISLPVRTAKHWSQFSLSPQQPLSQCTTASHPLGIQDLSDQHRDSLHEMPSGVSGKT